MFSYKVSSAKSIGFLSALTYTIYNRKLLDFLNYTKNFKGVIPINIEIKKRNPIKEFFHNLQSRLEDILFFIIQKLPDKFIPHWLMNRFEKYLDKRISELKQESIKMTWRNMYLQNSLTEIHNRQQNTKEASPDN